jgi:hypothetical protein
MFLKRVSTIARFSLVIAPVLSLAAVGCGGSSNNTAGTGGHAGTTSTGTAGTLGGGGTTGTGGTGTSAKNCTVVPATSADMSILDFNTAPAAGASPSFGNNYMMGILYGGGTFIYPDKATEADQMGLSNDFSGGTWHITGLVKKYAGFGLYLTSVSDLSMFGGIQFDISGTFTMVGTAAPPATYVTMTVTDTPHEVDSLHTADGRTTCGSCAPAATEYDGTCATGSKMITFNGTTATQMIKWTDLGMGRRPPSFTGESPDPAKIDAIAWTIPWGGDTSPPYMVDITIDNIKYLPLTP